MQESQMCADPRLEVQDLDAPEHWTPQSEVTISDAAFRDGVRERGLEARLRKALEQDENNVATRLRLAQLLVEDGCPHAALTLLSRIDDETKLTAGTAGALSEIRATAEAGAVQTPALSVLLIAKDAEVTRTRLERLATQEVPGGFETIIVDCTPAGEVRAALRDRWSSRNFRFVRTGSSTLGRSFNLGVQEARGEYLLFLRDDLVPSSELLSAHAKAHLSDWRERVYQGAVPEGEKGLRARCVHGLLNPGGENDLREETRNAQGWSDLWSCHLSMPQRVFKKLEGFDGSVNDPILADLHLGVRLARSGHTIEEIPTADCSWEPKLVEVSFLRRIAAISDDCTHLEEKDRECAWEMGLGRPALPAFHSAEVAAAVDRLEDALLDEMDEEVVYALASDMAAEVASIGGLAALRRQRGLQARVESALGRTLEINGEFGLALEFMSLAHARNPEAGVWWDQLLGAYHRFLALRPVPGEDRAELVESGEAIELTPDLAQWTGMRLGLRGRKVLEINGETPDEVAMATGAESWTCLSLEELAVADELEEAEGTKELYDLIICHGHFLSYDGLEACIEGLQAHLAPGGYLAIEEEELWTAGNVYPPVEIDPARQAIVGTLPAYSHLLLSQDQIEGTVFMRMLDTEVVDVEGGEDPAVAASELTRVFLGDEPYNRPGLDDHLRILSESELDVHDLDIENGTPPGPLMLKELHRRHVGAISFGAKSYRALLRNPTA